MNMPCLFNSELINSQRRQKLFPWQVLSLLSGWLLAVGWGRTIWVDSFDPNLGPGLDLDIRVPESNLVVRLDHQGDGWVQRKQRLVLPSSQAIRVVSSIVVFVW
jgi:hypothetical protein